MSSKSKKAESNLRKSDKKDKKPHMKPLDLTKILGVASEKTQKIDFSQTQSMKTSIFTMPSELGNSKQASNFDKSKEYFEKDTI